jgi:predicted DNA-binding transcriptional regulator YafY
VASFEVGAKRVTASLDATEKAIAILRQRGYHTESVAPHDGCTVVRTSVSFDDLGSAARELVALGGTVEIIDPPELRERVLMTARDVVSVYR